MQWGRISPFLWKTSWWRCLGCPSSSRYLHVCVVGSGPAGFYTAEKIVTNQFSRVASNVRCSFFGNVSLGRDISLSEIRDIYDIVVLAYGAESDRVLNVPGEDLIGIHSAREFVWWYNGHPDCKEMSLDLENTDTAIILGQGNVALDAARILLRPAEELEAMDIADHALEALRKSSIRKVFLVGRRGPVQAACTAKELREITSIKNVSICISKRDLVTSSADEEELKNNRIQRRVHELLSKASASPHSPVIHGNKELHFVFFRKPHEFLPSFDRSRVRGISFEKTCLAEDVGSGKRFAVGTGHFDELDAGVGFRWTTRGCSKRKRESYED